MGKSRLNFEYVAYLEAGIYKLEILCEKEIFPRAELKFRALTWYLLEELISGT